jgi:hypothetical protein
VSVYRKYIARVVLASWLADKEEGMLFHNKAGQSMNLVDNITIKELLDTGVELVLSEKIDPDHKFYGIKLDDHKTIKELADMGVELALSEKIDPDHESWLAN